MELGIKKPNINFSQRDNVAGVSDRSIKKDSTNKTGILMLDQKRNKSISNATKKNYDMIKSTPIEKSSNFDQKKYVYLNLNFFILLIFSDFNFIFSLDRL